MSSLKILRAENWTPVYLAYLAPVLMMTMLVNQFLNLKTIDLFGLSIIASIITYPISLIVCDIMTEVYGYKRTRKVIYLCMLLYLISMLFVQLAVYLPPAVDYLNNDIYKKLFGQLPQIAIAGVLGYLVGELLNSKILSKLKTRTQGKHFILRALLSTGLSQIANCIIFFGVGFWGIMSFEAVITSSLISIGIILGYEILVLPLTYRLASYLKKLEGVDYYDQ